MVGSIIAIVQITQKIITACQFYIGAVDGASADLRVILIEVSALKGIVEGLQYLTKPNVADSAFLHQVASVTGPFEGCKKALEELEALFPSTAVQSNGRGSKRRKLDAAVAALAWPLKTGKAKKLLQEIIQHKTTINLALTAEFVYVTCFNYVTICMRERQPNLNSHDLKDVKRKAEQIQDLLTGKSNSLAETLSLSKHRKRA